MNTTLFKERLIEAALTDDIPETPTFDFPQVSHRLPVARWAGYAAAVCIVAAIVLPLYMYLEPKPTISNTAPSNDATDDLIEAFEMIDQHFASAETNLVDIVQ